MGKKKKTIKQLKVTEGKDKDGLSEKGAEVMASAVAAVAAAAGPASLKPNNVNEDAVGTTNGSVDKEVVYVPPWRRQRQQSEQVKNDYQQRGNPSKFNVGLTHSEAQRNEGVKIGSVKWPVARRTTVGDTVPLLSGLRLDETSETSGNRSKKLGNCTAKGPIQPSHEPSPLSSKPRATNKPVAQIPAKTDVRISNIKNRPRIRKLGDPVEQLPIPQPTADYLIQSSTPPSRLASPQPLLVILDLNGTLLHRSKQRRSKCITARPYLAEFFSDIISLPEESTISNPLIPSSSFSSTSQSTLKPTPNLHPFSATSPTYSVMIWSSARSENVKRMCNQLLTAEQQSRLVAMWARDRLQLSSAQYAAKLPVYKQLKWVWASDQIKETYPERINARSSHGKNYYAIKDHIDSGAVGNLSNSKNYWGQHNTVLLDDSASKAKAEPYNVIVLPEFEGFEKGSDCEYVANAAEHTSSRIHKVNQCMPVLQQVWRYLEELSYQRDVSSYIRAKPFVAAGYIAKIAET